MRVLKSRWELEPGDVSNAGGIRCSIHGPNNWHTGKAGRKRRLALSVRQESCDGRYRTLHFFLTVLRARSLAAFGKRNFSRMHWHCCVSVWSTGHHPGSGTQALEVPRLVWIISLLGGHTQTTGQCALQPSDLRDSNLSDSCFVNYNCCGDWRKPNKNLYQII